jgi:hypothetical protein
MAIHNETDTVAKKALIDALKLEIATREKIASDKVLKYDTSIIEKTKAIKDEKAIFSRDLKVAEGIHNSEKENLSKLN